jgi:hypothetical protein
VAVAAAPAVVAEPVKARPPEQVVVAAAPAVAVAAAPAVAVAAAPAVAAVAEEEGPAAEGAHPVVAAAR